jgi:hypothetical protein
VILDVALYSDRLLDWLYSKQASKVRQRQAKEESAKEWLRGQHPGASEYAVNQTFGAWFGPDITGKTESDLGYVDVGAFLQPLGIRSRAAYDIVNYAAERDWLIASDNTPLGRGIGGVPAIPRAGETPRLIEYYDRVLITEAGIRTAEANRLSWHDIMPQAASLAQRLLMWLSSHGESDPGYLPNFLVSTHACARGRPLFTAALLQQWVKYLATHDLLDERMGSPQDDAMDVWLTSRGSECVVGFHGDVERYLNREPQAGSTTITVTGSTNVNVANHSHGSEQHATADPKLDDLIKFAGVAHQIASTLNLSDKEQAALEASAVTLGAAAQVPAPDRGYLRRIADGIMRGLASAAPTFASQTAIELGEKAIRALGG